MRVGICINDSAGSGIGNYTKELVSQLENIDSIEVKKIQIPAYEVPVFGSYISASYGVQQRLKQYENQVDLFHLPSQTQAAGLIRFETSIPVVVTVHDIIPLVSNYDNILLRTFAQVYERGLQNADGYISISEHTHEDLVDRIRITDGNSYVVYPSITVENYQESASESRLAEMGISKPYLLYVGSQTSKKNVSTVIEALKDLPEDITLVVVGSPGLIPGYLTKYSARKHGVRGRVIQTGFVDVNLLSRLYESALAFVFPSNYEGFGRPPLEAMANGTPVIATSATAVPEIVGDAAMLCSPDQPTEWSDAVLTLLEEDNQREMMIKKGYNRLNQFNWEDCAQKTVAIYEDILNNTTS
ncbi:glycosyl transferase [Halarchaeum grantii]|uniref:Glycosyl transferase n=1 Tax=Halarchaeum grantii TaxID=1193105 RepID=A0A830EWA3_9EURY|nr:glycosyltransferase family 1 protein [Halarchaeum grantii]GGL36235.1 glycosyl transferase [Halarchaeum grantii]